MAILAPASTWQYYAMDILSGEWLHRDLPLRDVQITDTLSGPGAIKATIDPDIAALKTADGSPILNEWATLIIAEADGAIRSAGILVNTDLTGPTMSLDCVGPSHYPAGQVLEESLAWSGTASLLDGGHGVDPLEVLRTLWAYLQGKPDGNLGVVVDSTASPYRVGSFTPTASGTDVPINRVWVPTDTLPAPAAGKILTWLYSLNWWDNIDIGSKIDELAKQAPFDYRDDAEWSSDARDAVTLRLRLGAPRLGVRQTGLRFVEGENISEVVKLARSGDDYANYVSALGAGEGQMQLRATASKRDGRLRRMVSLTDASKTDIGALTAEATTQLNLTNKLVNITGFTIRDHPNAPIGSFDVGDDVLLQTHVGWQPTTLWVRVTSATVSPATGDVQVTCSRSDRFNYSPGGVS